MDINAYPQPTGVLRDNSELTNDTTWLTKAHDSSKWDSMESDVATSRLKQPIRPTTTITTTTITKPTTLGQSTHRNKAHDHDEGSANDDDENDDDDTLL